MSATELLNQLLSQGVAISAKDGKLRCQGDQAILTPEILDMLREHKAALLQLLAPEPISWSSLEIEGGEKRSTNGHTAKGSVPGAACLGSNGHNGAVEATNFHEINSLVLSENSRNSRNYCSALYGATPRVSYERISSAARMQEVVDLLVTEPVVAIDLETKSGLDLKTNPRKDGTSLNPYKGSIRLISFACSQGTWVLDTEEVLDFLSTGLIPLLQSPGIKIFHNAMFDASFLEHATGIFPEPLFDTEIASRALYTDARGHGLADVAARLLGITMDKKLQKYDYRKPLTEAHLKYSALDAFIPLQLYPLLQEEARKQELEYILQLDHRVLKHFLRMRRKGVWANWTQLSALAALQDQRVLDLTLALDQRIHDFVSRDAIDLVLAHIKSRQPGTSVNWHTTGQLKPVLHLLGVKVDDCTKATLAAAEHTLLPDIRAVRAAKDFYDDLKDAKWLPDIASDERVHPSWNVLNARTGRTSCSDPNMQNVRSDPDVRACFVPDPGYVFLILDFSQIEPRVLSQVCGDARMIEILQAGKDLYSYVAHLLLGIPLEDIDEDGPERRWAKTILLATCYGQGAKSLAARMSKALQRNVSEREAAQHLDNFYREFSGVRAWDTGQRQLLKRTGKWQINSRTGGQYPERRGVTVTLSGRRRIVETEPQALNSAVQGSAADIAKEVIAALDETQTDAKDAHLIMFVHDEYVIEVLDTLEAITSAKKWLLNAVDTGMQTVLTDIPSGIAEESITVAHKWIKPKKVVPEDIEEVEG